MAETVWWLLLRIIMAYEDVASCDREIAAVRMKMANGLQPRGTGGRQNLSGKRLERLEDTCTERMDGKSWILGGMFGECLRGKSPSHRHAMCGDVRMSQPDVGVYHRCLLVPSNGTLMPDYGKGDPDALSFSGCELE